MGLKCPARFHVQQRAQRKACCSASFTIRSLSGGENVLVKGEPFPKDLTASWDQSLGGMVIDMRTTDSYIGAAAGLLEWHGRSPFRWPTNEYGTERGEQKKQRTRVPKRQ